MSDQHVPPARLRPFQRIYADEARPLVEAIHEHRTELQKARQEDDRESILASLGPLSEAYRQLGELDPAVSHAEEALALAVALDRPKQRVANGLRLATALQYRNEHARALPIFRETLALAREQGYLVDFVLQHLGKCLVELGRVDEAIDGFEEALALRRERGDEALVSSTLDALAGARRRASTS